VSAPLDTPRPFYLAARSDQNRAERCQNEIRDVTRALSSGHCNAAALTPPGGFECRAFEKRGASAARCCRRHWSDLQSYHAPISSPKPPDVAPTPVPAPSASPRPRSFADRAIVLIAPVVFKVRRIELVGGVRVVGVDTVVKSRRDRRSVLDSDEVFGQVKMWCNELSLHSAATAELS
jgi:hypothetical protein